MDFARKWAVILQHAPVRVTLLASLMLSLLAILGVATIGKDAAFYLDTARQVSEQGVIAAQRFDWPWFVLLLAGSHKYLGLPLEFAAYLWCALFLAGTCALLVDVVRRRAPQAVWWAVLVVLAMPAFNEFRNDILREFGFWFFSALTLWLALNWAERGGWSRALVIFPAILGAVLFRLEAVLLLPALALWQLPGLFFRERRAQILQLYALLGLLAVLGGLTLAALLSLYNLPVYRIVSYVNLLNPLRLIESFNVFASQFGDSMINKYSRDDAGQIVFFGLLAALLIKFVQLLGPFALLLLDRASWRKMASAIRCFGPFGWAMVLYVLVLLVFFIQQQFINSRYVSFLNLLAVPLVAVLLASLAERHPRLGRAFLVLALLVMIANVVSLGAKKTHFVDAGQWLAQNTPASATIYYDDGRIAYYAGRGYPFSPPQQAALEQPEAFDYLLIEADVDEPWLLEWLAQKQLRVLARFANRKDDAVLVIGR